VTRVQRSYDFVDHRISFLLTRVHRRRSPIYLSIQSVLLEQDAFAFVQIAQRQLSSSPYVEDAEPTIERALRQPVERPSIQQADRYRDISVILCARRHARCAKPLMNEEKKYDRLFTDSAR